MATFPPISFGPAPSNPCHAPARYFALVAQDDLTRFSIPPLRLDIAGRFVDPIAARSSKPEHFQLDPRVPLEEHRFAANGPLVEREGVVVEELWSEHVVERQEEPVRPAHPPQHADSRRPALCARGTRFGRRTPRGRV